MTTVHRRCAELLFFRRMEQDANGVILPTVRLVLLHAVCVNGDCAWNATFVRGANAPSVATVWLKNAAMGVKNLTAMMPFVAM